MFKTILNITLSFILLTSTVGFSISEHYCKDNLVSVSLNFEADPCCDDGNCCRTESEYFQLEEDFVSPLVQFNFDNEIIIDLFLANNILYNTNTLEEEANELSLIAESPPPPTLHCVLSQLQTFLL